MTSFKIDNYAPSVLLIMNTEDVCKSCNCSDSTGGNYSGTGFFGPGFPNAGTLLPDTMTVNNAINLLREPVTYYPTQFGPGLGVNEPNPNAIIIGNHVDVVPPNSAEHTIDIGINTGQIDQQMNSIAIGVKAGYKSQQINSIAFGYESGYESQGANSISIGLQAGYNYQNPSAVAIGTNSGGISQGGNCIAIGENAGFENQNLNSVCIGTNSGFNNQGGYGIAIGFDAGNVTVVS